MGRQTVTRSEIIARFWAACEGHDLQGRMPTIKQLREWTGSSTLDWLIGHQYTLTVFAGMVGLKPNQRGFCPLPCHIVPTPSTYTLPQKRTNRPTCNGCEWARDGLPYCVLPRCLKGVGR